MAKLYGIGVGPGDKELLTVKAVRIIEKCDVIVSPSSKDGGRSIALDTASCYIKENAEVIIKHFPMGGANQEEKIYEAFKTIEDKLKGGKDVAFLTIGDPFVYSTYVYLLDYINKKGYQTETVPGITSFCACASIIGEPLVMGDESLLVVPADKVQTITDERYVVVMKIHGREKEVIDTLEAKNFKYTYIKKAGREGQEVIKDKSEILKNREYMSLIIACRK